MTTQYRPDELEAQAARAMLAALEEIDTVCNESRADLRRRMGTRVGNAMTIARAAIAQAKAAGIQPSLRSGSASKTEGPPALRSGEAG